MTDQIQSTDFKAQLDLIMYGKELLPNYEEMTLEKGVAHIAAQACLQVYSSGCNAKVPQDIIGGKSSWGHWATYFLNTTQGGSPDGTGLVAWWDHGVGRIGRFAICKHYKITGQGANPTRGWHPGRCEKCGLDMSVDSGD